MDIDDDTIQLLAELAFIAGGYRLVPKADAISAGLEVLRPDSERPHLIRAISQLNLNDAVSAERILREQALRVKPDSSIAKAFLGIALHMQGRISERDRMLNQVAAEGDDEDAARIAHDLLGSPAPS